MVKWKEPEKKNAEKLLGYTVKYCRIQECHDLGTNMPRDSVAHNITQTVIGRLQAFSNYSIQVFASNKAGSSRSDTKIVTTEMAGNSHSLAFLFPFNFVNFYFPSIHYPSLPFPLKSNIFHLTTSPSPENTLSCIFTYQ